MKQIRAKYANNPDFDPDKIKVASTACEGLSRWFLAMEKYDKFVLFIFLINKFILKENVRQILA